MNSANLARQNNWQPGDKLKGDGDVIQITAIGERMVLAKLLSRKGTEFPDATESNWVLEFREWRKVK